MTTLMHNPLAEIELRVQNRSKDLALELDRPDVVDRLRSLVEEEIQQWSADFKRGARPYDLAEHDIVADRVLRNLAGYGPLDPLINDPDVWEIMINAPDSIFVKRHLGPSGYHDEVFHDDSHVTRILTKILDDASTGHRKLDPAEGLQDAQLENGARLHIVHPDVARGGHTMVNIRKFTGVPIRSLDELVQRGTLTPAAAAFLKACVRARLSIVFAGPPGSGKTTMLSCCATELDPAWRVVTAEEVFEVDIPLPNVASMQTRAARADRPAVDLRRLVSGFLRMSPDVAIVGEVRDKEALPLLLALSSGVKGFTTTHAGSARQALTRLRFICQLSETASEIPMSALNTLVCEAIDIVVHSARTPEGVRVTEIIAMEELAAASDSTQFTVTQVFGRTAKPSTGLGTPGHNPLSWTGNLPIRATRALEEAGYDVRALIEPTADTAHALDRWSA